MIRSVQESDIDELSQLYMEIYLIANPIERWTFETAKKFVTYFFEQCTDLFFVAE